MRSPAVLGVLTGLLIVAVALVAAIAVLPNLAPSAVAVQTSAPTPRDVSASSPTPGGPIATPSTAATQGPGASATGGSPAPSPSDSGVPGIGLAVGQEAPPLVVDRLGGGQIDLAALRGKPVWINFMASWCPSSRDELPLVRRYQALLGDSISIVLVDVREDAGTVAAFAKAMKLDMPIGLDPGGRAQRAWSAFALPIHFWVDASGIVRSFAYGGVGRDQMEAGIRKVLPNAPLPTPVPPSATPALPGVSSSPAPSPASSPGGSPAPTGTAAPSPSL